MDNLYLIFFIPLIFITNFFLKKKKILLNYTGQKHQTYTFGDYIPLSGGFFIILFFIINFNNYNYLFLIYLLIFYITGLIADLNILKSPNLRFILQIIILFFFIINFDLSIADVRIDFINDLLENYFFNIFFVLFCLLVFINGSNFIDGNNGLAIGYFLIIYLSLISILSKNDSFEINLLISFSMLLIIILIFNLTNQFYLGDNGIYLLSIYTGFILINFFKNNPEFSPYFIANLLWYPAFEILFSMVRKMKYKFSPMKPDIFHLHQLIFYYLKQKLNLRKNMINSVTGIVINFYNCLVIYFATLNVSNTEIQISLLSISVLFYLFCYLYFYKFKKLSNKK